MTSAAKPGATVYDTPNDLELRVTRVVDARCALAFDVWTNPRHLPQWLLGPEGWTMPVCEIDLRVGGAWRFVWRKGADTEMEMTGIYLEVTPPTRVVSTERWGPEWPETRNTVEFVEHDGMTTITLTVAYPTKEAREAAMVTGMKDGMNASFARFDAILAQLGGGR